MNRNIYTPIITELHIIPGFTTNWHHDLWPIIKLYGWHQGDNSYFSITWLYFSSLFTSHGMEYHWRLPPHWNGLSSFFVTLYSTDSSSPLAATLQSVLFSIMSIIFKIGFVKLNIQKTNIMASSPITSWQIDEETVETVTDFIFLSSKITADDDHSHTLKDTCSLEEKPWLT